MLWAVGGRYGYEVLEMKLHNLRFFYRGHEYMAEEEKHAQLEALAAVMGGSK